MFLLEAIEGSQVPHPQTTMTFRPTNRRPFHPHKFPLKLSHTPKEIFLQSLNLFYHTSRHPKKKTYKREGEKILPNLLGKSFLQEIEFCASKIVVSL